MMTAYRVVVLGLVAWYIVAQRPSFWPLFIALALLYVFC